MLFVRCGWAVRNTGMRVVIGMEMVFGWWKGRCAETLVMVYFQV